MPPLLLSFAVAGCATLFAASVGILVGAGLSRPFRGRELVDVFLTLPLVLPPTVLGYYMLHLLGRRAPLGRLFEIVLGHPLVFSRAGAVVAATLGAFPIVVKASRASLESVDLRYVQVARTLGRGKVAAFFSIHLPLAGRGILAAVVLAFARSLGDFGLTLMLAGNIPGETQTAALFIYGEIEARRETSASEAAALLGCFALALLYLVNRLAAPRHVGTS